MPFLLAMDLPVGSQVPFQTNPQLPLDPIQLAVPLQVEGTEVESFDPVARAARSGHLTTPRVVRHIPALRRQPDRGCAPDIDGIDGHGPDGGSAGHHDPWAMCLRPSKAISTPSPTSWI